MLKWHMYIITLGIIQFFSLRSAGQNAMPDYACVGQTRQYYVIPGPAPGSTYKWWVDGKVVSGHSTSEFTCTWNSSKTYLLEVQERSSDGCRGPKKSGLVFVNPQPEIRISVSDTIICSGEFVSLSVQNPSGLLWGKWTFDFIVEPDVGITGNSTNGIYTRPAYLHEIIFNNDKDLQKVVYRFIPRIISDDGVQLCEGKEVKITVWIYRWFRGRV